MKYKTKVKQIILKRIDELQNMIDPPDEVELYLAINLTIAVLKKLMLDIDKELE